MGPNGPDVKALFIGALDREPGEDRAAYLDAHCAGDAELRRRVEALLRAPEQAGAMLDRTQVATVEASTHAETAELAPGPGPEATRDDHRDDATLAQAGGTD